MKLILDESVFYHAARVRCCAVIVGESQGDVLDQSVEAVFPHPEDVPLPNRGGVQEGSDGQSGSLQ